MFFFILQFLKFLIIVKIKSPNKNKRRKRNKEKKYLQISMWHSKIDICLYHKKPRWDLFVVNVFSLSISHPDEKKWRVIKSHKSKLFIVYVGHSYPLEFHELSTRKKRDTLNDRKKLIFNYIKGIRARVIIKKKVNVICVNRGKVKEIKGALKTGRKKASLGSLCKWRHMGL